MTDSDPTTKINNIIYPRRFFAETGSVVTPWAVNQWVPCLAPVVGRIYTRLMMNSWTCAVSVLFFIAVRFLCLSSAGFSVSDIELSNSSIFAKINLVTMIKSEIYLVHNLFKQWWGK